MASANLDIVRGIYADWEHGDYTRTEWADPEIDFEVADGPAPAHMRNSYETYRHCNIAESQIN